MRLLRAVGLAVLVAWGGSARAATFFSEVELTCAPSVRGKVCGDGPLERTLAESGNAIEHLAMLKKATRDRYNAMLIQQIRRYSGYAEGPYVEIDVGLTSLLSATWGGVAGTGEAAIRRLLLAATRLPYDGDVQLVTAISLAQYESVILKIPWDQPSQEKARVKLLLERAAALNRTDPTPGFDETLRSMLAVMKKYPGYLIY